MLKKLVWVFLLFSGFAFAQNVKKVVSSEIRWKAYKSLKAESLSHYGTVGLKSGAVAFDDLGNLAAGTFIIDMNEMDAQDLNENPKLKLMLENHLRSDDFFDTSKFPTATFKITKLKKISDTKYKITGNLTIKGITQSISFAASVSKSGNSYTLVSDPFTFNRKKFGLNYNVFEDMIISNEVEMNVKLTAQ